MEHNSSEHWHQAEVAREASHEIARIDLYDTVLIDYEHHVAQAGISTRIRDLLALTNFYHREFGVHFEKRYTYREQLQRVVAGELENIGDARVEAIASYGHSAGFGLPRLESLAQEGVNTLPKNRIAI